MFSWMVNRYVQLVKYNVSCGIRQGGVLSPFLFAVYVDDLIGEL